MHRTLFSSLVYLSLACFAPQTFGQDLGDAGDLFSDDATDTSAAPGDSDLFTDVPSDHSDAAGDGSSGPGGKEIKIFSFDSLTAKEAATVLNEVFADLIGSDIHFTVNHKANQLVVRAPAETLEVIEAMRLRLEEEAATESRASTSNGTGDASAGLLENLLQDRGYLDMAKQLAELRRAGERLADYVSPDSEEMRAWERSLGELASEKHALAAALLLGKARANDSARYEGDLSAARRLAAQYRSLEDSDPEQRASLEQQIADAIERAFDERQSRQRDHLRKLQTRITSLQKRIAEREDKRAQLVQKTLKRLLTSDAKADDTTSYLLKALQYVQGSDVNTTGASTARSEGRITQQRARQQLENDLRRRELELKLAEVELNGIEREYSNSRKLADKSLASRASVEAIFSRLQQARLKLERAKLEVEIAAQAVDQSAKIKN